MLAALLVLFGLICIALSITFRGRSPDPFVVSTAQIAVGDRLCIAGHEGLVEAAGPAGLTLLLDSGERALMGAASLNGSIVIRREARSALRQQAEFSIPRSENIAALRGALRQSLASIDGITQAPPPELLLAEIRESALLLRLRWWLEPGRGGDEAAVRSRVLEAVHTVLLAREAQPAREATGRSPRPRLGPEDNAAEAAADPEAPDLPSRKAPRGRSEPPGKA
jgi:hypothetical protein